MGNALDHGMTVGLIGPLLQSGGSSTYELNSATKIVAYSTVSPASAKTFSKFKFYVSAVTGTLVSGDIQCDIYADNGSGYPSGASLGNTTTITALPTGAGWVEATTFSAGTSFSASTMYWVGISCPNAASGRYVRVAWFELATNSILTGASAGRWGYLRNYYDGGTWTTGKASTIGYRFEYDDATYQGVPCNTVIGAAAGTAIYGTRVAGAIFTTPLDSKLRVRGIVAYLKKTSSPTGDVKLKLYNDTTLIDTATVKNANVVDSAPVFAYFSTVREIAAGSTNIRLVVGVSSGGDSSNYFNVQCLQVEDTAASKAMGPMRGTWKRTFSVDEVTWSAVVDTEWPVIAMILDTDDEFGAASGGSGMIVHSGMSGGMHG